MKIFIFVIVHILIFIGRDSLSSENKEAFKLYQKGQFKEAIVLLKKGIDVINDKDLKLMSYCYLKLGDKANEYRILQQIISVNADDYEGHAMLGDFLMRKKDYVGATKSFRTAIDLKKDFRKAYSGIIEAYQKTDNRYELRLVYQDMIKLYGEKSEFIDSLCRLYSVDSFFQQAIEYCRKGLIVSPKNADNHVYLGTVLNKQQEVAQAQKILKKAADKFLNSEFAQRIYADLLRDQKNLIAAEKYYSAAVKADRKSLPSQISLAKIAFELKDYEMSIEAFKGACLINSTESIKELRKSIANLRLASNSEWLKKYSTVEDQCGQSEPTKE